MNVKRLLIFLAVILLLIDLAYFYPKLTGKAAYEWERANVTSVIDGDTIKTDKREIRLLCVNAPEEGKPFYNDAKTKLLELEGKEVDILRDKTNKDRYGRLLRYVSYKGDLINEKMVEAGLAHLYMCSGKFENDLRDAEDFARKNENGIWKKSEGGCKDCIVLKELNEKEEFFILQNTCNFKCQDLEVKDEANHFFEFDLLEKEEKTIKAVSHVWNDDTDSLFLRDQSGLLIYYHY